MIGIIGFGRFGELTARYLAEDYDVAVFTRSQMTQQIENAGAASVSLETACRQDVVILCVPISSMEMMIRKIAPLVSKNALVMDVCSVKTYPVKWMEKYLPKTVSYLPTHPMFGPDSAADSLEGRKIVLCKGRTDPKQYEKVTAWLKSKGLVVIETTPDEHDRKIALSLGLTHFIGRALARFGAEPLDIDTEGYKRLIHILDVVENDTWQLFRDMHAYNPYAYQKRQEFIDAMAAVGRQLDREIDQFYDLSVSLK